VWRESYFVNHLRQKLYGGQESSSKDRGMPAKLARAVCNLLSWSAPAKRSGAGALAHVAVPAKKKKRGSDSDRSY